MSDTDLGPPLCRVRGVNPMVTALFLLGYGLALPVAFRMTSVVLRRNRLALWGHQVGLLLAAAGWFTRGSVLVAFLHLGWVALASIWFEIGPDVWHRVQSLFKN